MRPFHPFYSVKIVHHIMKEKDHAIISINAVRTKHLTKFNSLSSLITLGILKIKSNNPNLIKRRTR